MATAIKNRTASPLSLPYPMSGILKAGQGIVVNATVAQVESALGSSSPSLSITPVNQTGNFDNAFLGQLLTPGIGPSELEANAVTAPAIAAGAVGGSELATGIDHDDVVPGVDETMTPVIAVPVLAVGDELVSVLVNTAGVLSERALADFTIGAAVLNVVANAANNAANQYLISWKDKT
jgi:hypothetical protein